MTPLQGEKQPDLGQQSSKKVYKQTQLGVSWTQTAFNTHFLSTGEQVSRELGFRAVHGEEPALPAQPWPPGLALALCRSPPPTLGQVRLNPTLAGRPRAAGGARLIQLPLCLPPGRARPRRMWSQGRTLGPADGIAAFS